MKRTLGKTTIALAALVVGFAQTSLAADIYVRTAKGYDLSTSDSKELTNMVKSAVRSMPEHHLVASESMADFVLQPSVVNRGDEMVLRVEKELDGEILAMSEESISSVRASAQPALAATELALQEDLIADADGITMDVAAEEGIPTSPTADRSIPEDSMSGATAAGDDQSWASDSGSTTSEAMGDDSSVAFGDVRAASPRLRSTDRTDYFQAGVGPAFGLGLESDNLLFNINAAYNRAISEAFSGKVFGDFNFASGSDSARFITLGVGGEYFPSLSSFNGALPYLTADIGYGFTRDADERTEDGPAIGVGTGFKFAASDLNFDVNLHYTLLTEQIEDTNPSVLGLRAAMNF